MFYQVIVAPNSKDEEFFFCVADVDGSHPTCVDQAKLCVSPVKLDDYFLWICDFSARESQVWFLCPPP